MRNPLSVSLVVALAASLLLVLFVGLIGYLPGPSLEEERRHHEELQEKCKTSVARCFAKDAVAAKVLAGRLTLLEAAARFRDLDRGPPAFDWEHFRAGTPNMSDEERHCREVINRVASTWPDEAAVVVRLERELEKHRRHGTLHLPEPAGATPPGNGQ
jgi:hypothetical protein